MPYVLGQTLQDPLKNVVSICLALRIVIERPISFGITFWVQMARNVSRYIWHVPLNHSLPRLATAGDLNRLARGPNPIPGLQVQRAAVKSIEISDYLR